MLHRLQVAIGLHKSKMFVASVIRKYSKEPP